MRLMIAILTALLPHIVSAQGYGMQWVLGDRESVLDFRNDTLANYSIGPEMSLSLTSANICDAQGGLLYYTNGIYIAGSDGNQILNGDSLNPCDYTGQYYCCGLNIPQAAIFLSKPGDSSRYYLLHFSNDTANGNLPGTLYYTQILNLGMGIVEKKNFPFGKGIFRQGGITACKHANGRDWWVVIGLNNSNEYFKYLVTPDTILGPDTQSIGPSYNLPLDLPYSKFSQDGSKYVTACVAGPILVMDFDRCSGQFSNPLTIFNEGCDSPSICSGAAAVEFSPSARFLYVSDVTNLNQYDLWSNTIRDSVRIYSAISTDIAQMGFLQLAPNGKLYASCWNGGFYILHAVNYPDLKGDSAVYVDTAFRTLTANTVSLPNMINYQLGALAGSGCDTIWPTGVANVAANNLLRIMPNPADKYVYVEMGMQGNYEFDFVNAAGQVVDKKETRQVDIFDTEHLAGGVYFIRAIDKNSLEKIEMHKFIVQH